MQKGLAEAHPREEPNWTIEDQIKTCEYWHVKKKDGKVFIARKKP